jgi:uncharacterized repeat protein (TIGR03843 family)
VELGRVIDLLSHGEVELEGRVPWSSNFTFLITVRDDDLEALAVYKPSRGEQPLWDFPSGTLCQREVAAYVLSRELGWPDIPPVVLRDGPHGVGSVQLFVDADPEAHYFTMRHQPEYDAAFRRVVLFDYVVNNADRKGGHLLKGTEEGLIWAIDHGLTFHEDYKLRTVIWEYADQHIAEDWLDALGQVCTRLEGDSSALCDKLTALISHGEVEALRRRVHQLLDSRVFPPPREAWRNVPYPLV